MDSVLNFISDITQSSLRRDHQILEERSPAHSVNKYCLSCVTYDSVALAPKDITPVAPMIHAAKGVAGGINSAGTAANHTYPEYLLVLSIVAIISCSYREILSCKYPPNSSDFFIYQSHTFCVFATGFEFSPILSI